MPKRAHGWDTMDALKLFELISDSTFSIKKKNTVDRFTHVFCNFLLRFPKVIKLQLIFPTRSVGLR